MLVCRYQVEGTYVGGRQKMDAISPFSKGIFYEFGIHFQF